MADFYRCLFLVTPKSETKCYRILVKAGEAVPQNLGYEYLDTVVLQASETTDRWESGLLRASWAASWKCIN